MDEVLWPFHNHIPLAVCENLLYLLVVSRRLSASWLPCGCVNLFTYVRIVALVQHTKTQGLETVTSNVLSCLAWLSLAGRCQFCSPQYAHCSHHLFIGSGSQTKPGRLVMFKCVLTFLSYNRSAEFRLQNVFYFCVLHCREGNSETYRNMLGWRILLVLPGPCFKIVTVPRRGVG